MHCIPLLSFIVFTQNIFCWPWLQAMAQSFKLQSELQQRALFSEPLGREPGSGNPCCLLSLAILTSCSTLRCPLGLLHSQSWRTSPVHGSLNYWLSTTLAFTTSAKLFSLSLCITLSDLFKVFFTLFDFYNLATSSRVMHSMPSAFQYQVSISQILFMTCWQPLSMERLFVS